MHYDELGENYTESVCEYNEIQDENRESEEFSDVKLVNGLWRSREHDGMISNAVKVNVSDEICKPNAEEYIFLMQLVARDADKKYSDVEYLHGSYNYVQGLKFLYQSAKYLRSGKDIDPALTQAAADAKMNVTSGKDAALYNATREMLKKDYLLDVTEGSNDGRFYKTMGFAMHLTGDTYAHRTMAPTYTVDGTNPKTYKPSTSATSADAMFGSGDFLNTASHTKIDDETLKKWALNSGTANICKEWVCFQRTVKIGRMEFRDVRNYVRDKTDIGSKYADNVNFCKERYIDGKYMCEVLFCEACQKSEFDGVFIMYPTEEYVKLNNLKGFAEEAGEDTSGWFTDAEWNEISTPSKY